MHPGPGPLALVGSGEYLEVMADVEGALIEGRPRRYVQIPTAAASEGPRRLRYWLDLGAAQAERLGPAAAAAGRCTAGGGPGCSTAARTVPAARSRPAPRSMHKG